MPLRAILILGLCTVTVRSINTMTCVETRTRVCNLPTDMDCEAMGLPLTQEQLCDPTATTPCTPVDCVVGPWMDDSACDMSVKSQVRAITTAPDCDGMACPDLNRDISCIDASCTNCNCFVLNGDTYGSIPNIRLQLLPTASWPDPPENVLRFSGTEVSGSSFLSIRVIRQGGSNLICIRRIAARVKCYRRIQIQLVTSSFTRITSLPSVEVGAGPAITNFEKFEWTTDSSTTEPEGCYEDLVSVELRITPDRRAPCDGLMTVRNVEFYSCSAVQLNRSGNIP